MRRRSAGIAIFLCARLLAGTSAAASALDNSLVTFDHIPSPTFGIINCAIRDDRGFLWFGTARGLCRYDGYQVRALTVGTDLPLQGNVAGRDRQVVTAMARMNEGKLLLATDLGLWIFDPVTETSVPFTPAEPVANDRITAIIREPSGRLWIGTASRGLFRIDASGASAERINRSEVPLAREINALSISRSGMLWVGTVYNGLFGLDISQSTPVTKIHLRTGSTPRLSSNEIFSICDDREGNLWIGTNVGVDVLDGGGTAVRPMNPGTFIPTTISSIIADPSGRVWIAASELGIGSFSGGSFSLFASAGDPERSLSSARMLYEDPAESDTGKLLLWVGTRNGIDKVLIRTNPFHNYVRGQDSLGMSRGAAMALCEDHEGVLWMGLWGGGVSGLKRTQGRYKQCISLPVGPHGLPDNDINAIAEDSAGRLWIGTSGGLGVLDRSRRTVTAIRHREGDASSLVDNDVTGVYVDRSGTVWVCTKEGVSRTIDAAGMQFRNYLNDPIDSQAYGGNVVSDVIEDRAGGLWFATYGRGLNRLAPDGSFRRYLDPEDTARNKENFVYRIAEDQDGLLWLTTRGRLTSFDPRSGTFTPYAIPQPTSIHIHDILPESTGELLLSTSIGLASFNPKTGEFTRFGSERGMKFSELFSEFARTRSGTVLAGGFDGFVEFDPGELQVRNRPPAVAITEVRVLDKALLVSSVAGMNFPHDKNFLSFSFAVLDYVDPLRNRFMYRMKGIENEWIDGGTRNSATYANLSPGGYTFEVKGCTGDQVWSGQAASIAFVIAPPYWRTWWFASLVLLVMAASAYALYRYRMQKLLEVERLRLRIADDLHDDVGSNLSTIAIVTRTLQRTPELSAAIRRKLAEIYDTAVTTSEGMKDIVWFVKPEHDSVDDLLLRMKDAASNLLADIEHTFETTGVEVAERMSVDFRRTFFLAGKEIFTNIAKHSGATNARIRVALHDRTLVMTVHDNGRGFDPVAALNAKKGNGLSSLHNRAAAIGGVCQISSEKGNGTTVRFSGRL